MANLWLRTLDSMTMNSEEHSEVFVDANDQRDWPVDDSVEAFMQARFRVLSMPHDEVQRNLSILRRWYSLMLWQHNRPWGFTIPVSLTNLQSTLILAWLLISGSSVFWRTKLVRLSLSRTIILLLRLTF